MNRIYQGRVSSVEIANPNDASAKETPWLPAPGGDELLWRHHAVFQDAINYYLVALLALASPTNRALGQLRQRIASAGDDYQIWTKFRRRGTTRDGLRDSVARYLTPGNETPNLDEAFAAVLAGCEASEELRDLCVSELLHVCEGDSPIKNQGGWMLSRFCNPSYTGSFPFDAAAATRADGEARLGSRLHEIASHEELLSFAKEIDPSWVVNLTKGAEPLTGDAARSRLLKSIEHFLQQFGGESPGTILGPRASSFLQTHSEAASELEALRAALAALPSENLPCIPANNRSIPDRLEACLLFKYFPTSFTLALLRTSFPRVKSTSQVSRSDEAMYVRFGGDAIELARGARGYVFRAFTSLPAWNPADTPEPQWKEFDIAAFKYALTALNQIEEKKKERDLEAAMIKSRLAYMHGGKPGKFAGATDQEEAPPILAGDPRIACLRAVLASEQLRVENHLTGGESVDYGLQPRTIRGFRDLRKIWRRRVDAGEQFTVAKQKTLRDDLHDFQTAHSETIGSVALFEALLDADNWIVWQDPAPKIVAAWAAAGFVTDPNDPLTALVEERELEEKLLRLAEPVRLTPADPIYSRRQYYFSDVSKFSGSRKAKHRHEPGALAFTTEIARRQGDAWRSERVRIRYSAPRLLRDGLRGEAVTGDLTATRWLQPLMEALAPAPALPQDLSDCAVSLMPDLTSSGERRVLLNFPVALDPAALIRQLGHAANWTGQFCGPKDDPFALRWPADKWPDGQEPAAWYHRGTPFSVLGIDLGTRDAGAMAHLTITPGTSAKPVHRLLGEAGGQHWFASLSGTQLIRLPGEDAKIFRAGHPRPVTEPFGERGRLASPAETIEAVALIAELGAEPDRLLGPGESASRRFSPLQNDALLIALRRAQAQLARWQSLSWRLRDEKQRPDAIAELATTDATLATRESSDQIATVDARLLAQRDLVTRSLVTIANRVVPLRDRHWVWLHHESEGRGYALRQTEPTGVTRRQIAGQRGLSHERLEQIEELRRRCQSLNRALQHEPGQRVRIGRNTRGDELPDPCPALLEKIEHLRDQRVDQTAHAILAAALGLRLRPPQKDPALRRANDVHGEYERFRAPVDFIVIEDLSRYLSSQDRARRENTRLMQWCHRQLVTKLRQLCETYGLPVLATPAAYSSRFCSRTGAAGFRAIELSPADLDNAPWRWTLERLAAHERGEKLLKADALAEALLVREVFADLDRLNRDRAGKPPRTLLAPIAGGPIFISLGEAPAMQADLNAAINIALRGVAAPDRHDIHHRIRTERKKSTLLLRQTSQREKARWGANPPALAFATSAPTERTPNLFADVARGGFAEERVTIGQLDLPFATGVALWTAVKRRAWARCAELNSARLARWQHSQPIPGHPEL